MDLWPARKGFGMHAEVQLCDNYLPELFWLGGAVDVTIDKDMEQLVELGSDVCCAGCFIFFLQEGHYHVVADLFSIGFSWFQYVSISMMFASTDVHCL